MPHYAILGLSPDATPADLKRAYRRLAMRWHPDRNDHPDSTERFKQIRAAYDALLNQSDTEEAADESFRDQASSTAEILHAADIRLNLEITLAEAFAGCSRNIHYQRGSACNTCAGSGEHGISRTRFCGQCHGSGRLRDRHSGLINCPDCTGRGFFIERICPDCSGSGRDSADVSLQIKIPPGMLPGDDLRLLGQGEPGDETLQAGDLFLTIVIRSHPQFKMNGRDLTLDMPINAFSLLAGSEIKVPLPMGEMWVQLDPGSAASRQLRLAGKGYPGRGKVKPGDFLLNLHPVFPEQLTAKDRKILLQLAANLEASCRENLPEVSNWWHEFSLEDLPES